MSNTISSYEIDDAKSVDDNLTTFAVTLATIDAPLATVLGPHLSDWGSGKALIHNELLDALYAATAPKEEPTP